MLSWGSPAGESLPNHPIHCQRGEGASVKAIGLRFPSAQPRWVYCLRNFRCYSTEAGSASSRRSTASARDWAGHRHMLAIETLATVGWLQVPAVRVNIAEK